MSILIQFQFILVLFVLVRSGDLAISDARGRDTLTLRAFVYGVVAILALLCLLFTQLGLH